MATTNKVLCRYFMSGCCMKGEQCTFSHDWKDKPDTLCRYYLKGSCVYGENCRYDHVRPKEQTEEPKPKKVSGPAFLPSLASDVTTGSSNSEQPKEIQASSTKKLVTLKKDPSRTPKQWVQAPEFVPGKKYHGKQEDLPSQPPPAAADIFISYSDAASLGLEPEFLDVITPEEAASLPRTQAFFDTCGKRKEPGYELCPFAEMGICPFGDSCEYLHGEICDMCNRQCLNPFDPDQQKAHHKECVEMHTREMERAFAVKESEGKTCGICLELVMGKLAKSERRFGILPSCEHCFCLGCLRKWRGSTHTRKKTIRACPLCRTVSYFVVPSEVWIDDPDQKQKIMDEYRSNMSKKQCKYFNMGKGTCPFGNSCFYRHEYPDGTKAEVTIRTFTNAEGESRVLRETRLWDFFQEREERSLIPPPVTEYWDDDSDPETTQHHQDHHQCGSD